MPQPIVFFTHHQGRGHINRALAIIAHFTDRQAYVITAEPIQIGKSTDRVETIAIPNMIGAKCATSALFDIPSPPVLHCTPVGVPEARKVMRTIADTLDDIAPALFVVDVSAEIALLGRILSVPTVIVRLHGDRSDAGHMAALEACTAVLAPFDESLEQDDYPEWARNKTFYSGGLCSTTGVVLEKDVARGRLNLDAKAETVVVLAGGGGSGTPYAPITLAARVEPRTQFILVGPVSREGHETEFANIVETGWVTNVSDYIAAADLVISSAGDNSVHEIARVGRPFMCIPEWRYFGEQKAKAKALAKLSAAVCLSNWPSSPAEWDAALGATRKLDVAALTALQNDAAALDAANFLDGLARKLWT